MSNRALSIGLGLAQGLEKSTDTMLKVMKARYEIKQNQELLNLKKKAVESDTSKSAWERDYKLQELDLMKKKGAVDAKTADMKYNKTKAEYEDLNKMNIGFYSSISKYEEPDGSYSFPDGTVADFKNKKFSLAGEQAIVDVNGNVVGYRPRKSVFQPAEKPTGDQPIVDASGKTVGYRPRGAVFQPKGSSTGPLFTEEESQAAGKPTVQAPTKELGRADINNVTLPETITTTSQAVEHLKKTYNMDDTKAKDWLRQNIK